MSKGSDTEGGKNCPNQKLTTTSITTAPRAIQIRPRIRPKTEPGH